MTPVVGASLKRRFFALEALGSALRHVLKGSSPPIASKSQRTAYTGRRFSFGVPCQEL